MNNNKSALIECIEDLDDDISTLLMMDADEYGGDNFASLVYDKYREIAKEFSSCKDKDGIKLVLSVFEEYTNELCYIIRSKWNSDICSKIEEYMNASIEKINNTDNISKIVF